MAAVVYDGVTYSSQSLIPLPSDIRNGMIAMGVIGLFSTTTTFSLMAFITYRMVFWKRYYNSPIHKNQIFILIYNLLIADFQQALSFTIAWYWVRQDRLVSGNSQCFAQGWLIQIGDMSSGLWVLAIAIHTFVNLVLQKQVRQRTFMAWVLGLWTFAFLLTLMGPVLAKDDFFVPAGAWCWISDTHEGERLYLHYLWIFTSQLGSLVIYTSIFLSLRGRLSNGPTSEPSFSLSSNADRTGKTRFANAASTTTTIMAPANNVFAASRARILRTAKFMVLYPLAYVALTLPLAAARVASMAGHTPRLVFFPIAGCIIASCGVVDVILYINTRKALIRTSVGVKGSKVFDRSTVLRNWSASGNRRATVGVPRDEEASIQLGSRSTSDKHIVISSQTVVVSEPSGEVETSTRGHSNSDRSYSLRSLVGREAEPQNLQDKNWLA